MELANKRRRMEENIFCRNSFEASQREEDVHHPAAVDCRHATDLAKATRSVCSLAGVVSLPWLPSWKMTSAVASFIGWPDWIAMVTLSFVTSLPAWVAIATGGNFD